jgi:uncharacterized membrane protein
MHPDFPSFMSFQYIFKKIGIDSIAVSTNYEQLQDNLPKPILVHITSNTDFFLLVEKADDKFVYVFNSRLKLEPIKKDVFLKMWKGNAMLVNITEVPSAKLLVTDKIQNVLDKLKVPFTISTFLVLLSYLIYFRIGERNVLNWAYIFLFFIGLAFSVCLLIENVNKHNIFIKKICSSKSLKKNVNCSSILNSKDAYFLGIFSWADIGLIFFLFLIFVSLIFPVNTANTLSCFASIVSFPYVFYSIYYQRFIAKSWCTLCLGVQTVFLLMFALCILFIKQITFAPLQNGNSIFYLIFVISFLISVYSWLKPYLIIKERYKYVEKELAIIKHYTAIKEVLFLKEPSFPTNKIRKIVLGNQHTQDKISVVFNTICDVCVNDMKVLLSFFKTKENTNLELIFFLQKKDNPISYTIAINLLHCYMNNPSYFVNVLEDYINGYPASKSKFQNIPSNTNPEELNEIISEQAKWCIANKFSGTPIILFNSKILPRIYSINDLDYMCF